MARVVLVVCAVLLCINYSWAQNPPTVDANCCGETLMDSGGHIVVEPRYLLQASLTLDRYEYTAVSVKICSSDPLYLQLWELIDESIPTFNLTWQHYYNGSGFTSVIRFADDNPAIITQKSRFGMYSTGPSNKYAIPYVSNTVGPNSDRVLYRTPYPLNSTQLATLSVGTIFYLDNLSWPRLFSPNIIFCTRDDCSDVNGPDGPQPDFPDGVQGPQGPPGPPGPPGTCGVDQCAADIPDILRELPEAVGGVKTDTDELKEDVDEVKQILNGLLDSKTVSGTCPDGFAPGTIGVGACYAVVRERVPLAVAHMLCRELFPGSILISIENQVTERFLTAEVIGSQGGTVNTESFWTRGIYSTFDRLWLWYDEETQTKTKMSSYYNWADNELTDIGMNRCLAYNVFFNNVSSVWRSENCHTRRAFICEYPKRCL